MNGPSHRDITLAAVKILEQMGVTVSPIISFGKTSVASSAVEADHDPDLELVDVDAGMDNPHTDQGFWTNDDEAHYSYDGG
jgi:precorrin-2 methylase